MLFFEDFLWQDDASRYKWLSVGLLKTVVSKRLFWKELFKSWKQILLPPFPS